MSQKCFDKCFWSNKTGQRVIDFAIYGAFLGPLIACILADGAISAGASGGAITITCLAAGTIVGAIIIPALIGAAVGAVLALVVSLIDCLIKCNEEPTEVDNPGDVATALQEGIIPTGESLTCEQAREMLAAAQERLAQAIEERDVQRNVVDRWNRRTRNARRAVSAAAAALAASAWWNVVGLVVAAATLAAAVATLVAINAATAREIAKLAALEASVAAVQAVLETWQALVNQLCGAVSVLSPTAPGAGGTIVSGGTTTIPD